MQEGAQGTFEHASQSRPGSPTNIFSFKGGLEGRIVHAHQRDTMAASMLRRSMAGCFGLATAGAVLHHMTSGALGC
jgi:hypothetical protein